MHPSLHTFALWLVVGFAVVTWLVLVMERCGWLRLGRKTFILLFIAWVLVLALSSRLLWR